MHSAVFMKIIEPKEYLEDLVDIGSNMRLFLKEHDERGGVIPPRSQRIVKVVAFETSDDPLGPNQWLYMVPKSGEQRLNYFWHISNHESYIIIESRFADSDKAGLTLSNGVTYNFFYELKNLNEREKQIFENSKEYNISDLFKDY